LFETEQEEDLETLMKEAEEEPYFYVKPLFETKRERLENVMAMIEDDDRHGSQHSVNLDIDPTYCGNYWDDD